MLFSFASLHIDKHDVKSTLKYYTNSLHYKHLVALSHLMQFGIAD